MNLQDKLSDCLEKSIWDSIRGSMLNSFWTSTGNPMRIYVRNSTWRSVGDSMRDSVNFKLKEYVFQEYSFMTHVENIFMTLPERSHSIPQTPQNYEESGGSNLLSTAMTVWAVNELMEE